MAGAYVATWNNAIGGNVLELTVTVSGAIAGNLLVAGISVRVGGDVFTTPSGWTELKTHSTGLNGYATYYRIATGTTSDDFISSWTNDGRPGARVNEYSGLDSIAPLEASDENLDNVSSGTTSQDTGSATPLSANGMAIAVLCARVGADYSPSTINNSFTDLQQDAGISGSAATHIAAKAYTTTAAQSATFSTTDVGSFAYGVIAVFKEAGGSASVEVTGTPQAQAATTTGVVTAQTYVTVSGVVTAQAASTAGVISVSGNVSVSGTPQAQAATTTGQIDDLTTGVLVNMTLVNESGTPWANLSGLSYAFFDQTKPDLMQAPVDQNTDGSTDGSGNVMIRMANSQLAPGATGYFIISDTDGTEGQDPAQKAFAGPVVVS